MNTEGEIQPLIDTNGHESNSPIARPDLGVRYDYSKASFHFWCYGVGNDLVDADQPLDREDIFQARGCRVS